jgi:hypothetical protein
MGMFVVTLNKASLKKVGIGAMCCALVAFSALLGRYISTRTVAVSASGNKIESAQDIQTWFTGYGLDVDGASITADKVKIPRKWDDSFSAFNGVVQQSGLDLTRYKGKTVEKWTALIPAASKGDLSQYGVLLVYRKKAIGAYLLEKPSGTVTGLKDAQSAALAEEQQAEQVSGGRTTRRRAGSFRPGPADFRRGLQRRLGRTTRRGAGGFRAGTADFRRGLHLHRPSAGCRGVSRRITCVENFPPKILWNYTKKVA